MDALLSPGDVKGIPKWALALIISVSFCLITILGSGNIYFVVDLIKEQRETKDIVYDLRQQVALLKMSFEDYKLYEKGAIKCPSKQYQYRSQVKSMMPPVPFAISLSR